MSDFNDYNMRTANFKFLELCKEIDFWKDRAEYFEELYEEQLKKYHELLDDSIKHSRTMMGNFLTAMLEKGE